MSLIAKQPEGIPPIPADTYQGVCYSLIDIGTHHSDLYKKDIPQIIIMWELPDLRMDFEGEDKPVNLSRTISKTYTNTLAEKSTLYAHLVGWRGAEFTEKELESFDLRTILKRNCLLTITNKLNQKGKAVAKVVSVSKLVKGMKVQLPERPIISFDMDADGILNIPENLPDWVKEQIKASIEYKGAIHAQGNPELGAAQEMIETEDNNIKTMDETEVTNLDWVGENPKKPTGNIPF